MSQQKESGQALVIALTMLGVFMVIVTTVSLFARSDLLGSQKQIGQTSAYYIAEAGLQRALQDVNTSLANQQSPATSFNDSNFQGGAYQVTLTPKSNSNGENVGYTVLSTGTYKNETKKISAWARPPVWDYEKHKISALDYTIYANDSITMHSMSGLLGIGLLSTHRIVVNDGNPHGNGTIIHGNGAINISSTGILLTPPPPVINGNVSSTSLSNIQVQNLNNSKKVVAPTIPMPTFDFDRAREMAKSSGVYVSHSVTDISLLGLSPSSGIIFIDGDLTMTGLDLLGIALQNRTIVVNGTYTGLLEVGGLSSVSPNLNIIAKQDINFTGAVTGLSVNGILFAQGDNKTTNQPDPNLGNISVAGQCTVNGYVGAKKINIGAGILSSLLGLITGDMNFTYNKNTLTPILFKDNSVEIVDQKVVP